VFPKTPKTKISEKILNPINLLIEIFYF